MDIYEVIDVTPNTPKILPKEAYSVCSWQS